MTLESLPELKKIWHHNLLLDSFSNLRILRVERCPCLLNLIPPHSSFKNLKEITVAMCEALEYVFERNNEILQMSETLQLKIQVGVNNDTTRGCHKREYKNQGNVNTPIEGGVHFDEEVSFL